MLSVELNFQFNNVNKFRNGIIQNKKGKEKKNNRVFLAKLESRYAKEKYLEK